MSLYIGNIGFVCYMFLLGRILDKVLQVVLEIESVFYRDILQEDFMDSYNNLIFKIMMVFCWVSIFCQKVEFVMKMDDDMFVNINGFLRVVNQYIDVFQWLVGGFCVFFVSLIRDKGFKWYVLEKMYFYWKYFGYCLGMGYVISMFVIWRVFEIFKYLLFFYLEDIFVGFCINKFGYMFICIGGFSINFIFISCLYKQFIIIFYGVSLK